MGPLLIITFVSQTSLWPLHGLQAREDLLLKLEIQFFCTQVRHPKVRHRLSSLEFCEQGGAGVGGQEVALDGRGTAAAGRRVSPGRWPRNRGYPETDWLTVDIIFQFLARSSPFVPFVGVSCFWFLACFLIKNIWNLFFTSSRFPMISNPFSTPFRTSSSELVDVIFQFLARSSRLLQILHVFVFSIKFACFLAKICLFLVKICLKKLEICFEKLKICLKN